MLKYIKEKFRLYFLSPLKLFFFRTRQSDKFGQGSHWRSLLGAAVLLICGLFLARFFFNLATVELPTDDRTLINRLKVQAKNFINFAGNNFSYQGRVETEQSQKIREQKLAALQSKLDSDQKFSRVTFFYTAPYLGSVAIPETWEKKYRTDEINNTIIFYYSPTTPEEYPLFQVGILSRDEWEKKSVEQDNLEVLSMVSNFVFYYQIYSAKIDNPVKAEDYSGMKDQLKSIIDSFKSYKNS